MADKTYISKIKQALSSNHIVIGLNRVMKLIKTGKLSDVYYYNSCPSTVVDELAYYRSLSSSLNLEQIPISNIEFGTMCKKQFMVSVVGIMK
ncbi:MAG: hypothetical protein DRN66_00985 [Candidatus Nanohalarchaeota archaeon]|nr:MAG: hypothetical protein DRN66_00985 [Candidatus Nanohaloarchaeota archaeon]